MTLPCADHYIIFQPHIFLTSITVGSWFPHLVANVKVHPLFQQLRDKSSLVMHRICNTAGFFRRTLGGEEPSCGAFSGPRYFDLKLSLKWVADGLIWKTAFPSNKTPEFWIGWLRLGRFCWISENSKNSPSINETFFTNLTNHWPT